MVCRTHSCNQPQCVLCKDKLNKRCMSQRWRRLSATHVFCAWRRLTCLVCAEIMGAIAHSVSCASTTQTSAAQGILPTSIGWGTSCWPNVKGRFRLNLWMESLGSRSQKICPTSDWRYVGRMSLSQSCNVVGDGNSLFSTQTVPKECKLLLTAGLADNQSVNSET